jgi:hypothetical protein
MATFVKLLIITIALLITNILCAFVDVIPLINDSTINKSTNYYFTVFPSNRIKDSDKIEINFPSQITIPNGDVDCLVVKYFLILVFQRR